MIDTKDGPVLIAVNERLHRRTAEGRVMLGTVDMLARWEFVELARGV